MKDAVNWGIARHGAAMLLEPEPSAASSDSVPEITRLHTPIHQVDADHDRVLQAWREETRSNFIALGKVAVLLMGKRSRMGGLSAEAPLASAGAGKQCP
jgi:hypothetical protein